MFRRFFSSSTVARAAQVTKPAPPFSATALVHGEFKQVKLSDYKGKYCLLFFYPMDFTFTCPTEILAFNKKYAQFKEAGCEVLGCSIDSEYVHYHWASLPQSQGGLKPTEGKLDIPLIADLKKTIAKDYGVLLEEKGVALRANVLIDPQGVVRHISVNDLPVGRSVDEAFRLLKAFQYTAEHGEVCTADWTVDKPDSMKANPKESLKYFGKQK